MDVVFSIKAVPAPDAIGAQAPGAEARPPVGLWLAGPSSPAETVLDSLTGQELQLFAHSPS